MKSLQFSQNSKAYCTGKNIHTTKRRETTLSSSGNWCRRTGWSQREHAVAISNSASWSPDFAKAWALPVSTKCIAKLAGRSKPLSPPFLFPGFCTQRGNPVCPSCDLHLPFMTSIKKRAAPRTMIFVWNEAVRWGIKKTAAENHKDGYSVL